MFFKKKQKESYIPVGRCNLIIMDILQLKTELKYIEKRISTLEHDKDLGVYNEVLDWIDDAENTVKTLEKECPWDIARNAREQMETELKNYKRKLQLIVFGAKFDHVD